jgi:hypothetical protein
MGIAYNTSIVTDGLEFALDAANSRSYSGSGVTANSLTSSFLATLTNGVGFGTTGTNYFIFDGVDDNIPFTIINYGTTLTIETWANSRSFSSFGMIFGFSDYDVLIYLGALGFNTGNGDHYGLTSTQVTNLGLLDQWKHYVFEMRSDIPYTNNKIYINGEIQSLSQILGSENASKRNFNNGNGKINGWLSANNYFTPIDISQFKIYNRALSAQEIKQNYNATKKRYI